MLDLATKIDLLNLKDIWLHVALLSVLILFFYPMIKYKKKRIFFTLPIKMMITVYLSLIIN